MKQAVFIANLISFLSIFFLVKSTLSSGRKKIFVYQSFQSYVLSISNLLLRSFGGVTIQLLSGTRNLLVAYDRFSKKMCAVFLIATTALGLYTNNRGWLGVLPVVATILYTLGSYIFTRDKHIKLNLTVNMALWSIYDFCILNFVSCGMDLTIVVLTLYAAFKRDSEK
ncbi:MAG: YgjV family protein [Pseudoramibacter sp.]